MDYSLYKTQLSQATRSDYRIAWSVGESRLVQNLSFIQAKPPIKSAKKLAELS